MIIDVTGIILTPGNGGKSCLGNGHHKTNDGEYIECCCEECDYLMCCVDGHNMAECETCSIQDCPNSPL